MHLSADIVKHVNDLLIVSLSLSLFGLESTHQIIELLGEVTSLDHRLKLA